MDSFSPPAVITAIADPEFESMVSGALFSQGWNVVARPLDLSALDVAILGCLDSKVLIIYSVDFPGLTSEKLGLMNEGHISLLGFSDSAGSNREWPNISPRAINPMELVAFIRSNIRTSSIRKPMLHRREATKSCVIAIGSAGHSSGSTTLAINLAQEVALLGKRTLLIDANFHAPAIAILLDLHKISSENSWREVSSNFSALEFNERNTLEFMERINKLVDTFDYIFIDLGTLRNLSNDLTDRRWISTIKVWAANFADQILITTAGDLLSQTRLKELKSHIASISLAPKFSLISILSKDVKKQNIIAAPKVTPDWLSQRWEIPFEPRICAQAERERTTLAKVNEKSSLRKAILQLAVAITS